MCQCAGKGDELLLPGAQRAAAFQHRFFEPLRQATDEVRNVYAFCGRFHLFIRHPVRAQADIVLNSAAEQKRVLKHHAKPQA